MFVYNLDYLCIILVYNMAAVCLQLTHFTINIFHEYISILHVIIIMESDTYTLATE